MIDWVVIKTHGNKEIGAIGFIDNKVAIIASFYDDRDGNEDGKVSIAERIIAAILPLSLSGSNIAKVAMQARVESDIILRDPSMYRIAMNIFLNFSRNLVAEGIYAVYFSRGISKVSSLAATSITSHFAMEYVIRKGMEKEVKNAYKKLINY